MTFWRGGGCPSDGSQMGVGGSNLYSSEDEVDKVGVWWILFHAVVDGVGDAADVLHLLLPFVIASAVGEDGDTSSTQAFEFLWCDTVTSACGKPEQVGVDGCHDDGCLLAFHEAYLCIGTARKQMLSEEALAQVEALWQVVLLKQFAVHPRAILPPVAVRFVAHNLSGAHLSLLVYLPEDDPALIIGTYLVVVVYLPESVLTDVEHWCHKVLCPFPENALRRVVLAEEMRWQWDEWWRWWRWGGLAMGERKFAPAVFLPHPWVVLEVFLGSIVVAARLLVVASAYAVVKVSALVLGVHIPYEALPSATVRAGGLLLSAPRNIGAFKLKSEISMYHCCNVFFVVKNVCYLVNSCSFVLPLYI